MAYTLAGIRQRVKEDKLNDTDYESAVIDRFINDAQRSIFNTYELPFMEKVFAGLLSVGDYIFAFPSDYQSLQSLKIVDPTGYQRDITKNYMKFKDFNASFPTPLNNTAGSPGAWTLHGNRLYFDKPTDQAYTLELYYIKKPTVLTDDADIPEIPDEFEEALLLGAYYRVLERNEDFDLAAYYRNGDYTEELEKLENRLGLRQKGKITVMSQPLRASASGRRGGRR